MTLTKRKQHIWNDFGRNKQNTGNNTNLRSLSAKWYPAQKQQLVSYLKRYDKDRYNMEEQKTGQKSYCQKEKSSHLETKVFQTGQKRIIKSQAISIHQKYFLAFISCIHISLCIKTCEMVKNETHI